MTNPGWIVLAWLVVALASALKFWSITRPIATKQLFPVNKQSTKHVSAWNDAGETTAKCDAYFSAITQAVAAL